MGPDGIRIAHLLSVFPTLYMGISRRTDGFGLESARSAGLCLMIC